MKTCKQCAWQNVPKCKESKDVCRLFLPTDGQIVTSPKARITTREAARSELFKLASGKYCAMSEFESHDPVFDHVYYTRSVCVNGAGTFYGDTWDSALGQLASAIHPLEVA